jgi:CIC family chloride channel protein
MEAVAPSPPTLTKSPELPELTTAVPSRRRHFARAAIVGLAAGLLAVGFRQALTFSETHRGELLNALHTHPYWGWAILPLIGLALGCMVGYSVQHFAPEASGSGIPHLKGVLIHVRTLEWRRLLPVKFFGGVAAIGAGLSLGREGPTVQMGAAIARALARPLGAPNTDIPQLLSAGAGAGLAAAFNAPLAGLVFVVEELHRELSSRTAAGALIAAVCATVVTQWLAGNTPSIEVHGLAALPLSHLPLAVVIGLIGGIGGVAFNRSLLISQKAAFTQKFLPRWTLPGLACLLAGLVAWWLPDGVGGGQGVAEKLLGGTLGASLTMLALLVVVKFVLTAVSYGSGAPGGIFAPMLLLGALSGTVFAQLAGHFSPAIAAQSQVLAVLGMAAFFTGSVRAPLTGIVLVSEMTGGYDLLFPICITVLIAYLTAEGLHNEPIYDALLEADLERSGHGAGRPEPRRIYMGIQSRSLLAGKTIAQAGLPAGCLVVAIERSGTNLFPAPDAVLMAGDHITILAPGGAPSAPLEIVHLCTGL